MGHPPTPGRLAPLVRRCHERVWAYPTCGRLPQVGCPWRAVADFQPSAHPEQVTSSVAVQLLRGRRTRTPSSCQSSPSMRGLQSLGTVPPSSPGGSGAPCHNSTTSSCSCPAVLPVRPEGPGSSVKPSRSQLEVDLGAWSSLEVPLSLVLRGTCVDMSVLGLSEGASSPSAHLPPPAWTQCTCGQVPWPLEMELCPLCSPQLSRASGHGKIPFLVLSSALKTALCQPIFLGRLSAWVSLLQGLPRPSSTLCTPGPDSQTQAMAASRGEHRGPQLGKQSP